MKKGLLTLATLALLALGGLAISSEQAPAAKDCPPCEPTVCPSSDCCPSQYPRPQ